MPVHQLLDEPDETNELPADKAKIYRSCIGILLYIASDFVECRHAIRGLAQAMSRPTVQAFICLRHVCLYLLGCVDNCTVMACTDRQGLLHYTPNEYSQIGQNIEVPAEVSLQATYAYLATCCTQAHALRKPLRFLLQRQRSTLVFQHVVMENSCKQVSNFCLKMASR